MAEFRIRLGFVFERKCFAAEVPSSLDSTPPMKMHWHDSPLVNAFSLQWGYFHNGMRVDRGRLRGTSSLNEKQSKARENIVIPCTMV